jgi:hypothetical protein
VNAYLLIDAVVQQTMVFIAQLATAGGVRAPLAHVAEQVFAELTTELSNRGVRKNVIADMFGMALRTYHRRVRELGESKTEGGRSVWEAVLDFIRERGPVSGREVLVRFVGDEPDEVPLGAPVGWEAAVLDHFQAMVTAIIAKLARGRASGAPADETGGSTWSLDVWHGHPHEAEAKALLAKTRATVEERRVRIDAHNRIAARDAPGERVVFYAGQTVRDDVSVSSNGGGDDLDDVS